MRDRANGHRAPVRRERAGEKRASPTATRPSLQTDAGWPTSQTCPVEPEIYVERYPELGNRQQISTGGGSVPLWSRDGRELFFVSPDGRQMLAVPVQSGTTLVAGRPQVLFEFPMSRPGGSRRTTSPPMDGSFSSAVARRKRAARHGAEPDRGAELVRGTEAPRADELSRTDESHHLPSFTVLGSLLLGSCSGSCFGRASGPHSGT